MTVPAAAALGPSRVRDEPGEGRTITMAIMSDLHAFASDVTPEPSTMRVGNPDDNPRLHPVAGIEAIVKRYEIRADVLLCPGDLGDRASEQGVDYGWQQVQRVAKALGEAKVIATAGNHDLSSRPDERAPAHDPEEVLKRLRPRFPVDDRAATQRFFSEHYAIETGDDWRVVTLNSSAHHGRGEREYDHGRVTSSTRETLLEDLKAAADDGAPPAVNVLLCHHHPVEYTDVDEPDFSSIRGGALLLKTLASGEFGRWIVVHGHKHMPHLSYAPGGSAAPVVFSAGSLSANLYLRQQSHTRNQFYVVEFLLDHAERLGLKIAGRFTSWYWVANRGWLLTQPGSGLPAEGGFGCRADGHELARQILDYLRSGDLPSIDGEALCHAFPQIRFLIPADLDLLCLELSMLGCNVQQTSELPPTAITPP